MSSSMKKNGTWSRRKSELSGFRDSIYRTDRSGFYIRADFNRSEKRIRLLVEDANERIYISVIEKGLIVQETAGGRIDSGSVSQMMKKKSGIFRLLPSDLVRMVNGHYGITAQPSRSTGKKRNALEKSLVFAVIGAAIAVIGFIVRAFWFHA